jgi:hypothetical protein
MATPLFKDEFLSLFDKHLPESDVKAVIMAAAESLILDDQTRAFIGEDPLYAENMRRALRQWKKHLGIVDAVVADGEGHNLDMLIDFLMDRNGLDMESTVTVILTPSDALNIRILSDIDEDGNRRS